MSDTLKAALWYAAKKGWPVLPLHSPVDGACSCQHPDCTSPGKHPLTPNGLTDATMDTGIINAWWRRWPHANAGIVAGPKSGLFILDVDDKNGGMDTIATLPPLPETVVALTGGGGLHYLFKYPLGKTLHNSAGLLGPGLDTRGDGGYIVTAPSLHISGANYTWEVTCRPDTLELADIPDWMLTKLLEHGRTDKQAEKVDGLIVNGARDNTLTSMAGTMRRRGFSERAILAALFVENEDRCVPPLDDESVRRIAGSVGRYAPENQSRGQGNDFDHLL